MVSQSFDYTPLNGSAVRVQGSADKIKKWAIECEKHAAATGHLAIMIGDELIAAKELLPHGLWGHWLSQEFQWSPRNAQYYMAISRRFKCEAADSHLSVAVLAVLAGESVPKAAVQEVVTRANSGEKITKAVAKKVVAKHTNRVAKLAPEPKAPEIPKKETQAPRDPKSEPPEPTAAPVPAADSEVDKMRAIMRLASELSLENLARVRQSIDRLHDGLAKPEPAKLHTDETPTPQVSQIEPKVKEPEPSAPSRGSLLPFDPLDMKVPEKFEGKRFRESWHEWVAYNVEQEHPLTESVAKKQMEQLAARSLEAAVAAIDKAIADRAKSLPAAKHARPKFKAPTVDDVRQYVEQSGFKQVDPERFVSYYEAQDWKLKNGNKMSDWKAGVRNWVSMRKEDSKMAQKSSAAADGAYKIYQPSRRRTNVSNRPPTGTAV